MKHRGLYLRGRIYWLAYQKNGVRQWISLETDDLAIAITRAAEIRVNPQLNQLGSFQSEIDAFLEYKRRQNEFTISSAHGRRYILRAFADDIHKAPATVTLRDIQEWYNRVLERHSATTANTYAMILRSFFRWQVEKRRTIRRNPCDGLDIARELGMKMPRFCTREERDKLIATCDREDLLFVLYCGFHAGLRKNEIIEARPFWFDLDAGLLHLRKTPTINFKDREERTIPLTTDFRAFLKTYGLRDPYMLQPEVKHGQNRYRYDFSKPFADLVARVGPKWVTPHTMRHTFCSLLASAGVSLYKIAKWVGDSPSVVEKRYAGLLPNDPDIERAHGSSPADNLSQH